MTLAFPLPIQVINTPASKYLLGN